MARYKPQVPYSVPLIIISPTYSSSYGVNQKSWPEDKDGKLIISGDLIFGAVRSFGGTERDVNGVYSIEDTAIVETWFDPRIKSDCRIGLPDSGKIYEILNEPEDIELRHQYMTFKVRRVKGGA